jgi:oxygen-independent coproporphyrinogen-3 oxidase
MNYWRNDPYVGVGASAVSYENGIRKTNISDVKEYIRRYGDGEDCASSSERLPPIKRAKETAAVKIRTREGIDFGWFKEKTGFDFLTLEKKALPRLIEDGLVRYKKTPGTVTGIELRHKGFLLADLVSSELL